MDERVFFKAAKDGDVAKVRAMLKECPALAHARDKDESTALHHAAWKGHAAIIEDLIDAGADITAHNDNFHWGTTAMHAAAHGNRPTAVAALLGRGADPNILKSDGQGTPLAETKVHNATAAAKLLREAGAVE